MKLFTNRRDAGIALSKKLKLYANQPNLMVLGLPRGGVPVAYEVAKALHAPLDVLIIRKIGVPGQEELAMGAIAQNAQYLNIDILQNLDIKQATINTIIQTEQLELVRREALYRIKRPPLQLSGNTVILIDDGIATGATVKVAIQTLRTQRPKQLILAIPVAAASTCKQLTPLVDKLVCLKKPRDLQAVGLWYEDFSQTTDTEVIDLMYNDQP